MYFGSIKPRKSNELSVVIIVVVIVSVISLYLLVFGKYASKIDVDGVIVRDNSVIVYASKPGFINKVYRNVGEYVQRGDILFSVQSINDFSMNTLNSAGYKNNASNNIDTKIGSFISLISNKISVKKIHQFYIRAPQSGYFGFSNVHVHEAITLGDPLAVLFDKSKKNIFIRLLSDSESLGYAKVGGKVIIRVHAYPYDNYGTLMGRIVNISPSRISGAMNRFGKFVILLLLDDSDNQNAQIKPNWLYNGMVVTGTFSQDKKSLIEWLFFPIVKGIKRNPDFWE